MKTQRAFTIIELLVVISIIALVAVILVPSEGKVFAAALGDEECPDCPADLNGDCTVDIFDLLELLENWGECADPTPGNCTGDLNEDGVVDVFDMLELLEAWGPCGADPEDCDCEDPQYEFPITYSPANDVMIEGWYQLAAVTAGCIDYPLPSEELIDNETPLTSCGAILGEIISDLESKRVVDNCFLTEAAVEKAGVLTIDALPNEIAVGLSTTTAIATTASVQCGGTCPPIGERAATGMPALQAMATVPFTLCASEVVEIDLQGTIANQCSSGSLSVWWWLDAESEDIAIQGSGSDGKITFVALGPGPHQLKVLFDYSIFDCVLATCPEGPSAVGQSCTVVVEAQVRVQISRP